jgi:antitoxin YqcF
MSVTEEKRLIARTALEAFGGKPHVHKYWDENKKSSIDILSCEENSFEGILSYSTIGLSDYSIGYEDNSKSLRIELVGACDSKCFPNILATCAFNIINTNFRCSVGTIFLDVVKMYLNNSPMQHILFLTPFLWKDNLQTINLRKSK